MFAEWNPNLNKECPHDLTFRLKDGSCPICGFKPEEELPSLAEMRVELEAARCKASLWRFIKSAWHVLEPTTPLLWNWHIEVIANHVQAAFEGWERSKANPEEYQNPFQNLLINVPPGTAKSRIVAVMAPVWAWLRWPSMRIRCLSANPKVVHRDAVYARDLVNSQWFQQTFKPEWQIRPDQDAKGMYANTLGGERYSAGITANITGERVDVIIVDDPHDAQDVHSDVQREEVLERWDNAIANRVSDLRCSIRIGVMQRLHEKDWAGHVLSKGNWVHLNLPLEFDPKRKCKTPIWEDARKPGEVLHSERFTPEVIAQERALGSYRYAAQMQQEPSPSGGGIFKRSWFKFYDELPKLDDVIMSVDCAAKKTMDGSYTVAMVIGRKGPDRYVVDVWRDRVTIKEMVDNIRRLRTKHPRITRILVEEKAAGPSVIESLQSDLQGIIPINPGADNKESRAMAIQPIVEGGNLWLPASALWLDSLIHELCTFPVGERDDQVDTLTQGLNYMRLSSDVMRSLNLCKW